MTTLETPGTTAVGDVTIVVDRVTSTAGSVTTLHETSFAVHAGEVVGIAGGSGAGKTTLLETIAGVRRPSSGAVVRSDGAAFVPQDDIIHHELPLRRTLLHAAALRLGGVDASDRAAAVDRVLERLDLEQQRDVRVGDLSGGQRKRASLATEMLTDPRLFFLDEPTSGLDPARATELMTSLRDLADSGSTVVLTTHSPDDLDRCDRVVFVARGGWVAFVGTPAEAKRAFGVDDLGEIYTILDDAAAGAFKVDGDEHPPAGGPVADTDVGGIARSVRTASFPRQLAGLLGRNVDLIRSNRLTMGILVGAPAFIIGTMAFLFPAGAFDGGPGSVTLAVQTLFWMAFNSFFFGITYGLLQVVGEFEIVRRERRIGMGIGAYVAAKLAVLVPMLAAVNVAQLAVMEATGRLPDLDGPTRLAVFASLQLLSTAAVALGLHASSAVRNASQATLALPLLCFPQVLFAGAVVPVAEMGWFAELMSMPLAVRWAFEPLGRTLDLAPAAAAEPGTAGFVSAFEGSPMVGWAVLVGLIFVGVAGTIRTLRRRTEVGHI